MHAKTIEPHRLVKQLNRNKTNICYRIGHHSKFKSILLLLKPLQISRFIYLYKPTNFKSTVIVKNIGMNILL